MNFDSRMIYDAITTGLPKSTDTGAEAAYRRVAKANKLLDIFDLKMRRDSIGGGRLWLIVQLMNMVRNGEDIALPESVLITA